MSRPRAERPALNLDVALVTYDALPQLDAHDQLLVPALAARGLRAGACIWDDPRVDWSAARAVVIRSAWDSHLRRDAFLGWARKVGQLTRLFNPPEVLRWNTHKGYLRALAQAGLAVTPTHFLTRPQDLAQLAQAEGWRALVLKPCVSAGALDTHVFTREELPAAQGVLAALLAARGEVMVQPYLESFEREGERSYLFFGGAFSHAVRRPPGLQATPRAFSEPAPLAPVPAELALAEAVVAASGGAQLLYARVDVATGADGRPLLQELEAAEPRLFLLQDSGAAARLADALVQRL